MLLCGDIPQGVSDFQGEAEGVRARGMSTAEVGGGLRGGRGNDRWGASLEAGAASVSVTRCEVKAFGALVESTVLFLVAFSSADEAGVVESRVIREEDRVGLIKKGFSPICSFLGFLGT